MITIMFRKTLLSGRDQAALNAHVARLQRLFGPPDELAPYPPTHHRRQLPKALLALFEHGGRPVRRAGVTVDHQRRRARLLAALGFMEMKWRGFTPDAAGAPRAECTRGPASARSSPECMRRASTLPSP